jgi:hypothetical protein
MSFALETDDVMRSFDARDYIPIRNKMRPLLPLPHGNHAIEVDAISY